MLRVLLAALLLSSCAPRRKAAAPAAPPPPRAAAAPKPVTPESKRQIEQEYYLAVSAYADGQYGRARTHLQSILALDPRHPGALTLKKRIDALEKSGR